MSTNRLYRAVKELQDAEARLEATSLNVNFQYGKFGHPGNFAQMCDVTVGIRAAKKELQLAMEEAKGIIEAPSESARRVAVRCAGERDVARHLLRSLAEQGFEFLDSDEQYDGNWVKDTKVLLELLMDLDMLNLQVRHTKQKGGWDDSGWILLVRGNSPEEMISDHTTNLEQYLKPTFRYIKSFYDPTYIVPGE